MRIALVVFSMLLYVTSGCGGLSNPVNTEVDKPLQPKELLNHFTWGRWEMKFSPDTGQASVTQLRDVQGHHDVTPWLQPPACNDCLTIQIIGWSPVKRIAKVMVTLRNPTTLTAYDVKTIVSDYDSKEFLNPDAWCDFHFQELDFHPYYIFAENEAQRAFAPGAEYSRIIEVHVPQDATNQANVTVDVSWPGPQVEPWRIDNVIVSGPLQNDNTHFIGLSCHVRNMADGAGTVTLEPDPLGVSSPMGDNGQSGDYVTADEIWGYRGFKTDAPPGSYEVAIYAKNNASQKFTVQKFPIEVIEPVLDPPPIYIVSMMHAEDQQMFLTKPQYMPFANNLRTLMDVFDTHNAKIAFQPDWTFIQGTVDFDATLFADLQASGHGVDTHAHEFQFDIGGVHDLLDDAGVQNTIIVNGGWAQTWGEDGNAFAYIAHFLDGTGGQMFLASNAWKWSATQETDALYTPIRPSITGDWMVHDPNGPVVYLPGAVKMAKEDLSSPAFFDLLPGCLEDAINGAVPGKINLCYWHDSLHNYGGPYAQTRITSWGNILTSYIDPKVADGTLIWANFGEMYQIYIAWENDQ